MATKTTSRRSTNTKKQPNRLKRIARAFNPTSFKGGMALFALVFAIGGGSVMLYKSFAATPSTVKLLISDGVRYVQQGISLATIMSDGSSYTALQKSDGSKLTYDIGNYPYGNYASHSRGWSKIFIVNNFYKGFSAAQRYDTASKTVVDYPLNSSAAYPMMGVKYSYDGQKIAYTLYDVAAFKSRGLYVANADGTGIKKILSIDVTDFNWQPHGRKIAYNSSWSGVAGVINDDGTSNRGNLPNYIAPAWSADGAKIAYHDNFSSKTSDVIIENSDGSNSRKYNLGVYAYGSPLRFSQDGNWIVYQNGPQGQVVGAAINALHLTTGNSKVVTNILPGYQVVKLLWLSNGQIIWQENLIKSTTPIAPDTIKSVLLDGSAKTKIHTFGDLNGDIFEE